MVITCGIVFRSLNLSELLLLSTVLDFIYLVACRWADRRGFFRDADVEFLPACLLTFSWKVIPGLSGLIYHL